METLVQKTRDSILDEELNQKGLNAAARFLKAKGYEILERDWSCPAGSISFIAQVDNTLCFINVKTKKGVRDGFSSFESVRNNRSIYEAIAAHYLESNGQDLVNSQVRFDEVLLMALDEERAFLRLHTNCLGCSAE